MAQSWGPTGPGKLFTGAPAWRLRLDGHQFSLTVGGKTQTGSVLGLEAVKIAQGTFWSALHFPARQGKSQRLDGIPNNEAQTLRRAIASAVEQIRHQERVQALLHNFDNVIAPVLVWSKTTVQASKDQLRRKGWLTAEFVQSHSGRKPTGLDDFLSTPEVIRHLDNQPVEVQVGLKFWRRDFASFAAGVNERHLAKQLIDCKAFFDSVEKSPLTQEQSKAVVCFDNRVLRVLPVSLHEIA